MAAEQSESVRVAVGAINAWFSGGLFELDAYIQALTADAGEPGDIDAQLIIGLAVITGRVTERLARETGRTVHEILAGVVETAERSRD